MTNQKLYQLSDKYQQLEQILEGETLAPKEVLQEMLEGIKEEFDQKVIAVAKMVLSLQADNVAINAEIGRLGQRQNTNTSKISWLKEYLLTEMTKLNIKQVKSQICTVSVRPNPPSCEVLDETLIPANYIRTIPEEKEIDRRSIIDHFKKTGEIVSGTNIVTDRKSLVIK